MSRRDLYLLLAALCAVLAPTRAHAQCPPALNPGDMYLTIDDEVILLRDTGGTPWSSYVLATEPGTLDPTRRPMEGGTAELLYYPGVSALRKLDLASCTSVSLPTPPGVGWGERHSDASPGTELHVSGTNTGGGYEIRLFDKEDQTITVVVTSSSGATLSDVGVNELNPACGVVAASFDSQDHVVIHDLQSGVATPALDTTDFIFSVAQQPRADGNCTAAALADDGFSATIELFEYPADDHTQITISTITPSPALGLVAWLDVGTDASGNAEIFVDGYDSGDTTVWKVASSGTTTEIFQQAGSFDAAGPPKVYKGGPANELSTSDERGIPYDVFKDMAQLFIASHDPDAMLFVFGQCLGGNLATPMRSIGPEVTVLSATSPGQLAVYGGYDDDAAAALFPDDFRTSDDVHAAGVAGKHPVEDPIKRGPVFPLDPTSLGGPITRRHVLVYAGTPDGTPDGSDVQQRDTIVANFAGKVNTSVTTVGGDGMGGWDFPGTFEGLRAAMIQIGTQLGPGEQFIMWVGDHGGTVVRDRVVPCPPQGGGGEKCTSIPLRLGEPYCTTMSADPDNVPRVLLTSSSAVQPPPADVQTSGESFSNVPFDIPVDLDGDLTPDFWQARIPLDESLLDCEEEVVIVDFPSGGPASFQVTALGAISLSTGNVQKAPFAAAPAVPSLPGPAWPLPLAIALLGIWWSGRRRST